MKSRRQRAILEIIGAEVVRTQEELAQRLRERGMEVTQATVSRDIKELGLIKVPVSKDESRYAPPAEAAQVPQAQDRLRRLLRDTVTHVDSSLNIVVIRTLPGHAHAVAGAIDHSHWPEVLGTVAGDDTIFIVVKPVEAVEALMDKVRRWVE
ncbi:arginine repressor [Heliomicrobium modesticaldum Ice1]|uniref:Arginine repressor n=1 Tax=Heliobacterium modesticaldum (strain ATCC 51547 / Ice1) TaxID=498761 RepID=ARGR_HELMI|nr:arginine repressor [Heliomicrobium modesticaldum]B0TEK0.1 RecName: Full=Arginine repressor [Heliomicrobium modesticaldum Ice1]ABZ82919.1 arginine repressor [Heliomicrobium modesticaldum Ice1]